MSILDLDKELDLKEYYTDKIVKFFRKNGPNGWGFSSYLTDPIVINAETLFRIHQLPNILETPENYALYTFSHGSIEVFCNDMSYIL